MSRPKTIEKRKEIACERIKKAETFIICTYDGFTCIEGGCFEGLACLGHILEVMLEQKPTLVKAMIKTILEKENEENE